MQGLRRICLFCFCILLAAVMIAAFDIILLSNTTSFTTPLVGCQFNPENLPRFGCTGTLARMFELILNLPLLLIYAPLFTVLRPPTLTNDFIVMLYSFDVVLVLALAHPVLAIAARWRAKRAKTR